MIEQFLVVPILRGGNFFIMTALEYRAIRRIQWMYADAFRYNRPVDIDEEREAHLFYDEVFGERIKLRNIVNVTSI